jgi:hypothetical protein
VAVLLQNIDRLTPEYRTHCYFLVNLNTVKGEPHVPHFDSTVQMQEYVKARLYEYTSTVDNSKREKAKGILLKMRDDLADAIALLANADLSEANLQQLAQWVVDNLVIHSVAPQQYVANRGTRILFFLFLRPTSGLRGRPYLSLKYPNDPILPIIPITLNWDSSNPNFAFSHKGQTLTQ